jgi:hypothetical protein
MNQMKPQEEIKISPNRKYEQVGAKINSNLN